MPDANEVKEKELNETNGGGGPGIKKSLTPARCRCGG